MKLYLLKYNMLYYVCECDENLVIPTNDFEAYKFYEQYNFLYNKKWIAESQNIRCGTSRDVPDNYPIIVRPIINLHGMSKGAYFLDNNNISKVSKISDNDFWIEILKGEHISVDVYYNDHGILGIIAFLGVPNKLFTFKYWEYLPDYQLPVEIGKWIKRNLLGFKGVFNLEIIGGKIIECHLRIGDLNYFQSEELTNLIIQCHQNIDIKLPKLNKIYLIPVFVEKGKYVKLKQEDIWMCVRRSNNFDYILNYFIDPSPESVANPLGGDRVCNLTVSDLDRGFNVKKDILDYITSISNDLH